MPIYFARLLEDGDFEDLTERTVVGLIVTDEKSVARYFASWQMSNLGAGMHVDIIVGRVLPHEEWTERLAISVNCSPHGGIALLAAVQRPFARRQALHCSFPPVPDADEELAVTARNIARFVQRNDSRIPEILRGSV